MEGDASGFQEVPRRLAPRPNPDALAPPPQEVRDGAAVNVTDPGVAGAPSDQSAAPLSGYPLSGGVSRFADSQSPPARLLNLQEAPPLPPSTRIVPPKTFRSWLQATHPDLDQVSKDAVVEVKGQWDNSGHVLHSLGIPCVKVPAGKLESMSFAGVAILVVDCAGNVPGPAFARINKFVHDGGYLLTTDWALDGCLTRAIPGYINWNGGYSSSPLVDATVTGAETNLLVGTVPRAYWKLDKKCETVHLQNSFKVRVLVYSNQLRREDPDEQGILACTFRYGRGKVLHLVGHFDNNSDQAFNNALPDPAPLIGISLGRPSPPILSWKPSKLMKPHKANPKHHSRKDGPSSNTYS